MIKNILKTIKSSFLGVSMVILTLILGCIAYLYPPSSTITIKALYIIFILVYLLGVCIYAIMVNVHISNDKVISYDETEQTILIRSHMNYENGRMTTIKYEDKDKQKLQSIAIGYVDLIHHNGTTSIKLTHINHEKMKELNIEFSNNKNIVDKLLFRPYIHYSDINKFELMP